MLCSEQVSTWRQRGFVLVPELLDISEVLPDMQRMYPPDVACVPDFGSGQLQNQFPFASRALNRISVHPILLSCVRQLLGVRNIRLIQSVAWAKYGEHLKGPDSNRDQRMHMDYGNNMWTHPPSWYAPNIVAAIVYYSNTFDTGGATSVVPRSGPDDFIYTTPYSHMPGIGGIPFANDRLTAEQHMQGESASIRQACYAREHTLPAPSGSVLFYRMDTWHRGTPVLEGKVRYVHNLAWRRADSEGISNWNSGFTRKMYRGHLERFISSLTPDQLETLGFPSYGSNVWLSKDMYDAVRKRYDWAGFDLDAYLDPPEKPEHWISGSISWRTTEPSPVLYHALMHMFRQLNIHVKETSRWTWILEFCVGPYYMQGECTVKTDHGQKIIDIILWEGNRRVWTMVRQCLQSIWSHGRFHMQLDDPQRTPEFVYDWLTDEDNILQALTCVGTDVRPEALIPLLSHECPNIVRVALRALALCTTPFECPMIVHTWAQRNPSDFMQREITRWAQRIVAQRSRL